MSVDKLHFRFFVKDDILIFLKICLLPSSTLSKEAYIGLSIGPPLLKPTKTES
jgi:hypothetical protein